MTFIICTFSSRKRMRTVLALFTPTHYGNIKMDTNANIVSNYCVSVGVAEQVCVLAYFDGNVDGELWPIGLWSLWCEKTPGRARINRVFVKYINIHTNRALLKAWVMRGCMNYDLQLVVITNQQQKSMTLAVVVLFLLLSPNSVTEIFLNILLNVVTLSWIYIDEVLPSAFRCLTTFSVPSFGEEKRGGGNT